MLLGGLGRFFGLFVVVVATADDVEAAPTADDDDAAVDDAAPHLYIGEYLGARTNRFHHIMRAQSPIARPS